MGDASARTLRQTDYDAMTLSPIPAAPPSFHTSVFPVSDEAVMAAARTLVGNLKGRKYYTDTATFDLRCGVCGAGLKGEKGAREHAMATGREAGVDLADLRCRVWGVLMGSWLRGYHLCHIHMPHCLLHRTNP